MFYLKSNRHQINSLIYSVRLNGDPGMKVAPTETHFLDQLFEAAYLVDTDRKIVFWNKAAEKLTGYTKDEVLGKSCRDNILMHLGCQGKEMCTNCPLINSIDSEKIVETDAYMHHKDGHRAPVHIRIVPVKNSDGKITGAIELFTMLTSQESLISKVEKLEKLSNVDPLTDLANRRFAENILLQRIGELHRFGWNSGIIFFDIDDFKLCNDNYSHNVGDRILSTVAKTLQSNIRGLDFVSRWGGEEFVVILRNISKEFLIERAELLRSLVMESFIFVGKKKINITVSGGVTMLVDNDDITTVIERADKLMYESKRAGKNRITSD